MINTILKIFLFTSCQAYINSCIVFFTGGSNIMSTSIYTDFLSHIESEHMVVKMPYTFTSDMYKNTIEDLDKQFETITYLAHSSGATTAINKISPLVERLILLDPVATPNIEYNANLDTLRSVNIINARRSYQWSYIPPFIPFIPTFKLDANKLKIDKNFITIETIEEYGHSDLIDKPYRDIMHFTGISRGNPNRKEAIYNYHNLLHSKINNIVYTL